MDMFKAKDGKKEFGDCKTCIYSWNGVDNDPELPCVICDQNDDSGFHDMHRGSLIADCMGKLLNRIQELEKKV